MSDTPTLAQCYADAFATIFAFRAAKNEERPSYRALRSRLTSLLAESKRCVEENGGDTKGDAQYAVVALIDETISSSDWEHAEEWGHEPLQVHYFGQFVAGEEFFHRLDALLQGGASELLDVYYTCLCAGFRGMYRDDPDALSTRRRRAHQLLKKVDLRDSEHITEAAYGRNLERSLARSHFPVWWVLPFAGAAVFFYVAFWVVLRQQVGLIIRLAG